MNCLVINWISSRYKLAVKTSQHRYLCNNTLPKRLPFLESSATALPNSATTKVGWPSQFPTVHIFNRPGFDVYPPEWSNFQTWPNYVLHRLVRQLHIWINSAFSIASDTILASMLNGDSHASHVFSLNESYTCKTCTKWGRPCRKRGGSHVPTVLVYICL